MITWVVMDGFCFNQQIGLSKSLLTVYVPSHDASDMRKQADRHTQSHHVDLTGLEFTMCRSGFLKFTEIHLLSAATKLLLPHI